MQKDVPTLRPATHADAPAVREMVFAILREYNLQPDPAETDADLTNIEEFYRNGWFAVLEQNGQIIGSVGLLPVGEGTVELRKMYLRPEHRRQGIGRRMLEAALAEARELGARKVVLGTAAVLVEAVALYERFGFRKSDECHPAARCDQVWEMEITR